MFRVYSDRVPKGEELVKILGKQGIELHDPEGYEVEPMTSINMRMRYSFLPMRSNSLYLPVVNLNKRVNGRLGSIRFKPAEIDLLAGRNLMVVTGLYFSEEGVLAFNDEQDPENSVGIRYDIMLDTFGNPNYFRVIKR